MDELFKDYYKEQEQIAYQKAKEAKGWASEPICGTSFTTHTFPGGYQIHFDTDSKEAYEAVQAKIRDIMGHGKPKTKGDKIRDMTDEELAEWILREPFAGFFSVCPPGTIEGADCPTSPCEQCWLDWLKSPAEEEE